MEQVAETDDTLLNKYLAGEPLKVDEVKIALRKATIGYKLIPIYCGTSLRNKAVQPVLDAIVDYLPSPKDLKTVEGVDPVSKEKISRKLINEEKFSALTFKIQLDPHVGKINYTRIYSGILDSGSYVYNVNKGKQERVSRILLMHANQREEIDKAYAGEIVALVGPKDTKTGDTLADKNSPILLEQIVFPEPVISLAIEPKTKADQEKLSEALAKLSEEDPTFKVKTDEETGQTLISGMGELHLEILVDRMKREFKVEANVGKPQVAYRETITETVQAEGKFVKQSGGRGKYGHVWLEVGPNEPGKGYEFENAIVGGVVPKEYIIPVSRGVEEAMKNGVVAGYHIVDVKVKLYDGSYHDVDSDEISFKVAGSMAFRAAAKKAKPILLEPLMSIEVTTPEEYMGDVMGDLSSRRGKVEGFDARRDAQVIKAKAPLSEMFGYSTVLRSMTQGRAIYSMQFSHYAEVPRSIAEEISEKSNINK